MKPCEGRVADLKNVSDIVNIARRDRLSSKGMLIKAALIILSIWDLLDKTENVLFRLMTPGLHHSDLIPVCPAIKTWKVLVDAACLHLSPSESEALFFIISLPPQINSSVHC